MIIIIVIMIIMRMLMMMIMIIIALIIIMIMYVLAVECRNLLPLPPPLHSPTSRWEGHFFIDVYTMAGFNH